MGAACTNHTFPQGFCIPSGSKSHAHCLPTSSFCRWERARSCPPPNPATPVDELLAGNSIARRGHGRPETAGLLEQAATTAPERGAGPGGADAACGAMRSALRDDRHPSHEPARFRPGPPRGGMAVRGGGEAARARCAQVRAGAFKLRARVRVRWPGAYRLFRQLVRRGGASTRICGAPGTGDAPDAPVAAGRARRRPAAHLRRRQRTQCAMRTRGRPPNAHPCRLQGSNFQPGTRSDSESGCIWSAHSPPIRMTPASRSARHRGRDGRPGLAAAETRTAAETPQAACRSASGRRRARGRGPRAADICAWPAIAEIGRQPGLDGLTRKPDSDAGQYDCDADVLTGTESGPGRTAKEKLN